MKARATRDDLKTKHIDLLIGQRLRQFRDAMGLTRAQVASAMGVSQTRWQDYEAGERFPAARLWQFCERYGIEVREVFEGLPFGLDPVVSSPPPVAGPGAAFDSPMADDVVRAIGEAVAGLSPVERRLALAALRGMGTTRMKSP